MPLLVRRGSEGLLAAAVKLRLSRRAEEQAHPSWQPLPHQIPPEGDWTYWLTLAGRGSGKTLGGAHYIDTLARQSRTWGAIIAPTFRDARHDCVEGPTGLLSFAHDIRFSRTWGELEWPNGTKAQLFGAYQPDDVNRLRGPQHHWVWCEELAAWRQLSEAWDMMDFGLRLGDHPRCIITTTPKPRPKLKEILKLPNVVTVRAHTSDNPHLAESVRARLYERYEGTRIGRQELYAELLEEIEGALWQWEWIEANRVDEKPDLVRVVVAIDPAGTHAKESDETGIAVVGLGEDDDFYVLHAEGYRLSPSGWANRALSLYDEHEADRVIGERNQGGEMVEHTIRTERRTVPFKSIVASRGKAVRAEPVAALYEQGRVHHVGTFLETEEQMCSFPVANEHDDRVDAVVYAITELMERKRFGVRAL